MFVPEKIVYWTYVAMLRCNTWSSQATEWSLYKFSKCFELTAILTITSKKSISREHCKKILTGVFTVLLLIGVASVLHWLFTYIFSVYVRSRACYIMCQWDEFRVKNASLSLNVLFWHFLIFFIKKLAFIIFISLSDKESNFCNRILTNQKPDLAIRNCQWNCMLLIKIAITTKANGSWIIICQLPKTKELRRYPLSYFKWWWNSP